MEGKNWPVVLEYAESIRSGKKIACDELKQAVDRFFRDLENPAYELDPKGPEFCIKIIETTICHQQGETLDGRPLRDTPLSGLRPALIQPICSPCGKIDH